MVGEREREREREREIKIFKIDGEVIKQVVIS